MRAVALEGFDEFAAELCAAGPAVLYDAIAPLAGVHAASRYGAAAFEALEEQA